MSVPVGDVSRVRTLPPASEPTSGFSIRLMRPPDPSSISECPQNSGLRGEPFQRHRKDLKIWASARFAKDDESSYWAHMNGTDQMGDAAGAPAPPVM